MIDNTASILVPAVAAARAAIKRDRANRYSLTADWTLPPTRCSFWPSGLAAWDSPLIHVAERGAGVVQITVKAYQSTQEDNVCDGATLSPDRIPGILPAALFHDPWYCRVGKDKRKTYELLADEIGVPRKRLRAFGDALFYAIARAGGCPWLVARLYHAGIRLGYPVVAPFIAAAIAALALGAGCAGCIGTDGQFLDPGEYQPPAWGQNQ